MKLEASLALSRKLPSQFKRLKLKFFISSPYLKLLPQSPLAVTDSLTPKLTKPISKETKKTKILILLNMTSPSPGHRRKVSGSLTSDRKLGTFPPEKHSDLVRRRTGFISNALPPSTAKEKSESLRLTKVLLNVTVENSLGPVQVLMSPEETVGDLVRAALVIYQRDKRRPFLKDNDPNRYDLHYSPFTLQSLKTNEKLINLGSRNFFLRSRPSTSSCSDPANITIDSFDFPLVMFVHLLL